MSATVIDLNEARRRFWMTERGVDMTRPRHMHYPAQRPDTTPLPVRPQPRPLSVA